MRSYERAVGTLPSAGREYPFRLLARYGASATTINVALNSALRRGVLGLLDVGAGAQGTGSTCSKDR